MASQGSETSNEISSNKNSRECNGENICCFLPEKRFVMQAPQLIKLLSPKYTETILI